MNLPVRPTVNDAGGSLQLDVNLMVPGYGYQDEKMPKACVVEYNLPPSPLLISGGTLNCKNCGAPMQLVEGKDYLVCEYCTYTYVPKPNPDGVRILEEPTALGCPVCELPMVAASINSHRIWHCKKCRGILLPMSVFSETVAVERRRRPEPPASVDPIDVQDQLKRKLVCPNCADPMHTHPYGGPGNVVIDNCPSCRLNWLDYRELQRIITAPERIFKDESWLPSWLHQGEDEEENTEW